MNIETNDLNELRIGNRLINRNSPVYFIADIGANHDGDIKKAKELIHMAKVAGADAAKFQHFSAKTIVSNKGFNDLGNALTHQSNWKKSVYDVYKEASINLDWTVELKQTCDQHGIEFLTSPYSIELVDYIDDYINAYKIGSGDITYIDLIAHVAKKNKPYIIACGASNFEDISRVLNKCYKINKKVSILQCNTNYTGNNNNINYVNLNTLKVFSQMYPGMILGLSDHTEGDVSVLGAVALGAKIIEKHFTDNKHNDGPDHFFSMTPSSWKIMVDRTREMENALGDGIKKVEENEKDTVIVQRRSIRTVKNLKTGECLSIEDVICLRPCPKNAIPPFDLQNILGKKVNKNIKQGEYLKYSDFN